MDFGEEFFCIPMELTVNPFPHEILLPLGNVDSFAVTNIHATSSFSLFPWFALFPFPHRKSEVSVCGCAYQGFFGTQAILT